MSRVCWVFAETLHVLASGKYVFHLVQSFALAISASRIKQSNVGNDKRHSRVTLAWIRGVGVRINTPVTRTTHICTLF